MSRAATNDYFHYWLMWKLFFSIYQVDFKIRDVEKTKYSSTIFRAGSANKSLKGKDIKFKVIHMPKMTSE